MSFINAVDKERESAMDSIADVIGEKGNDLISGKAQSQSQAEAVNVNGQPNDRPDISEMPGGPQQVYTNPTFDATLTGANRVPLGPNSFTRSTSGRPPGLTQGIPDSRESIGRNQWWNWPIWTKP